MLDALIVHPGCEVLRALADDLRERGYAVEEREAAVGAAAFALRARPSLVVVEGRMPLVSGREIASAIRRRTAASRVLIYGAAEPGEAEASLADAWVEGEGAPLLASVARHLPPPGARDELPLGSRRGYVLVACGEATRAQLEPLAAGAPVRFTDSGTEALRLVCSSEPPAALLAGSALLDLPCVALVEAVLAVDARWRSRVAVVDEGAVGPARERLESLPVPRWSEAEPADDLAALVARLRT